MAFAKQRYQARSRQSSPVNQAANRMADWTLDAFRVPKTNGLSWLSPTDQADRKVALDTPLSF